MDIVISNWMPKSLRIVWQPDRKTLLNPSWTLIERREPILYKVCRDYEGKIPDIKIAQEEQQQMESFIKTSYNEWISNMFYQRIYKNFIQAFQGYFNQDNMIQLCLAAILTNRMSIHSRNWVITSCDTCGKKECCSTFHMLFPSGKLYSIESCPGCSELLHICLSISQLLHIGRFYENSKDSWIKNMHTICIILDQKIGSKQMLNKLYKLYSMDFSNGFHFFHA